MTEPEPIGDDSSAARTVQRFVQALQERDSGAAEAILAEDVVWKNVGYPALRGRDRILRLLLTGGDISRFEVKIHRIAAANDTVLVERTDAMVVGWFRLQFWVWAAFELHDGRIAVWRDYFDLFDVVKGLVRGMLGVFIPPLRPRL